MKRYPWEPWQEMYVLAHYGLKPTSEIKDRVGKTALAIRLKYHRMMGKCFKGRNSKQSSSIVPHETAA